MSLRARSSDQIRSFVSRQSCPTLCDSSTQITLRGKGGKEMEIAEADPE